MKLKYLSEKLKLKELSEIIKLIYLHEIFKVNYLSEIFIWNIFRAALAGASDQAEYGAAAENSYSAPVPPPVTEAAYDYSYDDYVEAPAATYGADYGLDTYEEETTVAAVEEYLSPEARRGRNRGNQAGHRHL